MRIINLNLDLRYSNVNWFYSHEIKQFLQTDLAGSFNVLRNVINQIYIYYNHSTLIDCIWKIYDGLMSVALRRTIPYNKVMLEVITK